MPRIEPFAQNLWLADGPVVSFYGFPYPTRMAIVRLEDEGLWIWSPIQLDPALETEIEALGAVKWVVSPNKIHHLFIEPWLKRWPDAQSFAPPKLAERKPNIPFDAELGDEPPAAWAGQIDQIVLRGSLFMEEVLFHHRASSTCIVGDLVQRHDPANFTGWKRVLMRLDGMIGADGSTPREWRASFLRRQEARESLQRVIAWSPERLVIAHGECAKTNGTQIIASALHWLTRSWPL